MVVQVTLVIQVTQRLGFMMGCHQRRLQYFRNKDRRNREPKINVVTINGIEVRGKRRQGFGLLGKLLKTLQIVFIVELSEHRILSNTSEPFHVQSPSPSNSISDALTHHPSQSFGLGPSLHHDIPGCFDYIQCILLTVGMSWGPIDYWAFSFKRRCEGK